MDRRKFLKVLGIGSVAAAVPVALKLIPVSYDESTAIYFGDGKHDATAYLQDLIDNKGGYIPRGTYIVSGTLVVRSKIHGVGSMYTATHDYGPIIRFERSGLGAMWADCSPRTV